MLKIPIKIFENILVDRNKFSYRQTQPNLKYYLRKKSKVQCLFTYPGFTHPDSFS